MAASVAAIACLALSVPFLVAPGVRLEFDEDSPAAPPYTRGFYPPEGAGWPNSYAWTELNARLLLPDLPRSTSWTLTIRAHSATPAGAAAAPVAIAEHGRSLGTVRFAPVGGAHYADVHLDLPAADQRGLRLDIASAQAMTPGAQDPRQLALQVDAIALTPGNRFASIPWQRVLSASAAMALLAGIVAITCGARSALWGGAAAAIAVGALGYLSSWLYLPMFDGLIGAAWLALAVLGAGLGARWAWGITPEAAGPATAVAVWFTVAKFALLIHPSMTIGDSFFHLNRVGVVASGSYFFTSDAPGGEFPYPVAFYVAVARIGSRAASIEVMRGIALVTDSLAGLLVALAVAAPAHGRRMLLGVLLWQTAPALFQPQALVYLTNSFGNSWSAIAGAFLILGLRPGAAGWLVAATGAAVVASLSHVSSFVLLAASIGAAIAVAAAARRWRMAAALALVLAVTVGAAWFIYYRHFTALYAQRFQGSAVAAAPAGPPAKLPIQRHEAHQTVYVPGWPALQQRLLFVPLYLVKYVGVGLLTLALMAAWQRIRRPERFDEAVMLALGIALAVGAALCLGQLTPVDLRYYLVAASLCAPVAAFAAAPGESTGAPSYRGVTGAVAAIAIAQGCWYMTRFLWNPLPR